MAIIKLETWDTETGTKYPFPVWVRTFEGRVISTFIEDFQAMSDIYTLARFALVMNDKGQTEKRLVNANFECDQSYGHAEVDAGEGVMALYRTLLKIKELELARSREATAKALAEAKKNRAEVGKKMVVFKGRKVPPGTTGVVAYVKEGRVLLKDESTWRDRKSQGVWVSEENLRAV